MADDQTQTPDPSAIDPAVLQRITQQLLNPQSAQPQEPPHSGDNRTWGSLLGQALVGGAGPGSTDAQNEQAGLRALQQVGLGMMAGSDYSQARHSLGSIVAGAIGGAQESNAAQNAAQLEYQKAQQEMQLARIKEAVPLLTLLQGQQQLANARNIALGNKPTGTNVNIGAVGADLPNDKAKALPIIAQRESGGDPTALNYVARADPTAYDRGATASGKYQIVNSTWREGMQLAGLDPSKYATARDAPEPVQDQVASALWDKYGNKPWQKGPTDWVKDEQGRYRLATVPGGPKAVPAPTTAAAPQTPPAASTAAPGVAQGDIAHPELAPGPPGSTGGAPIGIGAALAPPAVAGTPIPAGKLQSTGKPPGQAAADIIQSGVQLAQATPLVRGTGQEAGPSSAVATLATPATPEPGFGTGAATGYNVTPTGAAAAAPPPPPSTQVQPQAQPTAAQPDAFPPFTYQRGPLPASIQARIDNPAAHVSPDLTTALQVAAQSGDIGKMAAAKATIGAAADAVRTKALEEGEAYQTNERNKAQELHVKNAEAVQQNQRDAAARQQAIDLANVNAENTRKQNVESAVLAVSQKRLEDLNARAGIAQRIIRDSRTLEALAPQLGDPNALLANNPRLRDALVTLNLPGLAGANLNELRAQQVWDKLVTGFFQDTHVPGSGSQSNVEGEWMMRQFGGPEQNVEDRLTQLAIVRKLADHRITDNRDAEDLFTRQNGKLTGLDERIAQRNKLFDRPPEWNTDNPTANLSAQNRYLMRHPRGEPYAAWSSPDGGRTSGEMRYFRNEMVADKATGKARLQPVPLLGGSLVADP